MVSTGTLRICEMNQEQLCDLQNALQTDSYSNRPVSVFPLGKNREKLVPTPLGAPSDGSEYRPILYRGCLAVREFSKRIDLAGHGPSVPTQTLSSRCIPRVYIASGQWRFERSTEPTILSGLIHTSDPGLASWVMRKGQEIRSDRIEGLACRRMERVGYGRVGPFRQGPTKSVQ